MKNRVLVVGAGGAGLRAAIGAKESGAEVIVVTKEYATRSQTCMAQGGINAVLYEESGDTIESHIADTMISANSLGDEEAVRYMCKGAPKAVEWLDGIGVPFSRSHDARIAQRKLGGAKRNRACYAQDYTGLKILHTLYDRCNALGIEVINERYLLDILTCKNKDLQDSVCGAVFMNIRSGEIEIYEASSVIIATGGYAKLWGSHSTNSAASTGDGIAAAIRAGARVSDMEFVQFHPTALKNSAVLISESARGAGGHLVNSKQERFVDELLPRDEVSRAIYGQLQEGGEVFLDIRHLGVEFIERELPQEIKLAKLYEKVDPLSDVIPIRPAAHYTMGGIDVNLECMSSLKGLFAVGECANHRVHGANRLGGNSLLELIVFGEAAGKSAARYAKEHDNEISVLHVKKIYESRISDIKSYGCEINFYDKQKELSELFYKNVGIVRSEEALCRTLDTVEETISLLPKTGVADKAKEYNTNLKEFMEFTNMLHIARSVLKCAINRKESRGAHYMYEYPKSLDEFKVHSIIDESRGVRYEN